MEKYLKELKLLESLGLCQRWQLCVKKDGMHPDQKPLEYIVNLRLWPDGGAIGVVERENVFGDVFGSWTVKGICLFFLNRTLARARFSFHEMLEKVNDSTFNFKSIAVKLVPLNVKSPLFEAFLSPIASV